MRILPLLAAIMILAGAAIWSGIYNISALDPHWDVTLKIIEIARDRSIAAHGADVKVPPLNDPKLASIGGSEYRDTCRICHGAPGEPAEVIAQGLYPAPSDLLSGYVQKKWKDGQLFWIIDNGLKMTGMPAFDAAYEKDALIGIAAFVRRLPGMTPEQYRSLAGVTGAGQ